MQVCVRVADRVIQVYGTGLGDLPGCATEEVDEATAGSIARALNESGANVRLSADHQTVDTVGGTGG